MPKDTEKPTAPPLIQSTGSHSAAVDRVMTDKFRDGNDLPCLARQHARILDALEALISESQGVTGWHLNGDAATWEEVLPEFFENTKDYHKEERRS